MDGDLLISLCRRSEEQVDEVCPVSSPLLRLVALGGLANYILLAIHQLILNL